MTGVDPFPLRFEHGKVPFLFHQQNGSTETGDAFRRDRSRVAIRSARLLCQLRVPSVAGLVECLIDTGASLSIFPWKVWRSWPKDVVEWFEPSDENSRLAVDVKGISGVVAPARLGRVTIFLRQFIWV